MAYDLEFEETTVRPYLRNLNLSREGRVVMSALISSELRDGADAYRMDSERRVAPGSPAFCVQLIFRDPGRGIVHTLLLIVDDASAQYGILRIVYAEDIAGPPLP